MAPVDSTSNSNNWGKAFYENMVHYLGNPVARETFQQNQADPLIQVLTFEKVFPECKVFCSLGASHYPAVLGGPAEVILPCDDGWDVAEGLLANCIFFLVQNRMALGRGVAIAVNRIAPGFAERFEKVAIYFTNPFGLPQEFSIVNKSGEVGHMYLAFFITKPEYDFFCDRGAEQFEALLEREEADPLNLTRPSSV